MPQHKAGRDGPAHPDQYEGDARPMKLTLVVELVATPFVADALIGTVSYRAGRAPLAAAHHLSTLDVKRAVAGDSFARGGIHTPNSQALNTHSTGSSSASFAED
jgi:hypothetical protein